MGITENTSKAKNENEKKCQCRVGGNEGKMGILGKNILKIKKWWRGRQRAYGIARYGYLNTCAFIKIKEKRRGMKMKSKANSQKEKPWFLCLLFFICHFSSHPSIFYFHLFLSFFSLRWILIVELSCITYDCIDVILALLCYLILVLSYWTLIFSGEIDIFIKIKLEGYTWT